MNTNAWEPGFGMSLQNRQQAIICILTNIVFLVLSCFQRQRRFTNLLSLAAASCLCTQPVEILELYSCFPWKIRAQRLLDDQQHVSAQVGNEDGRWWGRMLRLCHHYFFGVPQAIVSRPLLWLVWGYNLLWTWKNKITIKWCHHIPLQLRTKERQKPGTQDPPMFQLTSMILCEKTGNKYIESLYLFMAMSKQLWLHYPPPPQQPITFLYCLCWIFKPIPYKCLQQHSENWRQAYLHDSIVFAASIKTSLLPSL